MLAGGYCREGRVSMDSIRRVSASVRHFMSLQPGGLTPLRVMLPHPIKEPIFIIGPPRSGSTMLFEGLIQLGHISIFTHREADHHWIRVIPYSSRQDFSDYISLEEMTPQRQRYLRASLYAEAVRGRARRECRGRRLREHFGLESIEYIDKTIANCFRLDLLVHMFPDLRMIFLVREPRANIASMIEGWSERNRFGKAPLTPHIERVRGASIPHWSYPAPPGWAKTLSWSLPEICTWSWERHVRYILDFYARTSVRAQWVRYEDLVASPGHTLRQVAEGLGWRVDESLGERLRELPLSRTVVTPPIRKNGGTSSPSWPRLCRWRSRPFRRSDIH